LYGQGSAGEKGNKESGKVGKRGGERRNLKKSSGEVGRDVSEYDTKTGKSCTCRPKMGVMRGERHRKKGPYSLKRGGIM